MAFGDEIRSAAAPSTGSYGIGGDANTIWHCDKDELKVYELSTSDFSVDRSAAAPLALPLGIGGDAKTIWHCEITDQKVYELDAAPPNQPGTRTAHMAAKMIAARAI